MAKIERINKSRKVQVCSKCGETIPVGSPYLKASPRYRAAIIRCTSCGLKSWETSGSEFIKTCGRISEQWEEDYGLEPESIKEDLENLRDECQEKLDNMPEQLQYSPSGETLQERIDMLEAVIMELDSIDSEDSMREEAEQEVRDENDLNEIAELNDDQQSELTEKYEEKRRDAIEEALSELSY